MPGAVAVFTGAGATLIMFLSFWAWSLWDSLLLYSCCTVVPSFALSERKKTENRLLAAALKEEAQAVAALHALEQQAQLHAKQALTEEVR